MAPPGTTPTTETAAGHDRQVSDAALTSKREAIRYLRDELSITGAQANRLYRAYEQDCANALRIGNDTYRSDEAFIDWLMRQAPGPGRQRGVLKREWRVAN